jgi:hypothetical protein
MDDWGDDAEDEIRATEQIVDRYMGAPTRQIMQRGDGGSRPRGSGRASGGGKAKKSKPATKPRGYGDNLPHDEKGKLNRLQLTGFTRGEKDYLVNRSPEVRRELEQLAALIDAGEMAWWRPLRRGVQPLGFKFSAGLSLDVYGLTDGVMEILATCPGSPRSYLAAYARRNDYDRIFAIDGIAVWDDAYRAILAETARLATSGYPVLLNGPRPTVKALPIGVQRTRRPASIPESYGLHQKPGQGPGLVLFEGAPLGR